MKDSVNYQKSAENYKKAIACIYNTLTGGRPTDFLKPLSASTANDLADFCLAIHRGMTVKDYFDQYNKEENKE